MTGRGGHDHVLPRRVVVRIGEGETREPGPRGGGGHGCQSILGLLERRLRVYSSRGVSITVTTEPASTTFPACRISTRAAIERTSARLWVTNSMLMPRCCRSPSS